MIALECLGLEGIDIDSLFSVAGIKIKVGRSGIKMGDAEAAADYGGRWTLNFAYSTPAIGRASFGGIKIASAETAADESVAALEDAQYGELSDNSSNVCSGNTASVSKYLLLQHCFGKSYAPFQHDELLLSVKKSRLDKSTLRQLSLYHENQWL
ncbi:hypothetical protein CFE70_005283 [Pyrenophora teres f. teres 0-1]